MTTGTWIGAKWLSLIFGVYQKFSQKINHFRRTGFYFFKVNTTLQEISLRTEVCVIFLPFDSIFSIIYQWQWRITIFQIMSANSDILFSQWVEEMTFLNSIMQHYQFFSFHLFNFL